MSTGGQICRVSKERTAELQKLVGSAQRLDLSLNTLDGLRLGHVNALTHPAFDLLLLNPIEQRFRHATDIERNRLKSRPQRRVFHQRACIRRTALSPSPGDNFFDLFIAPSFRE